MIFVTVKGKIICFMFEWDDDNYYFCVGKVKSFSEEHDGDFIHVMLSEVIYSDYKGWEKKYPTERPFDLELTYAAKTSQYMFVREWKKEMSNKVRLLLSL